MNRVVFYVDAVAIDKFIDFIIRGCYEYNEEKVIIHFDYNTPFLDLKAYNINNVVIGDVIRMYYSGTFQCTQADWYNNAYGFDVVNVERTFDAIPYTFIINEDYIPVMVKSEIDYKFHHFVYVQKTYYVIEEDNVCVPIDKLEIGQILYGFACATNPNEIVSLYTYNPKE